jgi:hypothetical protein
VFTGEEAAAQVRLVIESRWALFSSECQRLWHREPIRRTEVDGGAVEQQVLGAELPVLAERNDADAPAAAHHLPQMAGY